ncbi:MAG: hypothetical protein U1E05_15450, partial [Patescibacteria group bacterium]|nr:hypothetical protein [Patescibacteria group bacterium]
DLDLFLSWNSTANPNHNGAFPGWMDEFALYGYALSGNQILTRYANAPPLGPFHWSAANSSYTTDASWYGGTAPSGSDNAVISQGVCNASGLTVAGTGSLTVSLDGALNHTGTFRVGGSGAAGTMYQFGGATAISSDFYVADGSGSTGSRFTMTGGTLTVTGTHTVVGRGAEGHFLQEAGTVSLRRLFVSESAGSAGSTYTMNGGTLNINATTSSPPYGMEVGRSQSGTFTLNQGMVNVNNSQTLAIGVGGAGTFLQNGGVVNATGDIRIAQSAAGVYTIGGGTLNVAADKSLAVGVGNAAVFTQTGGTVNVAGAIRLAENAGTGVYRLQGGTLNANAVLRGTGGSFEFTGGILHARTFGSVLQPFTLSQTGGTLAPGNSIGTSSLFGDYQQAAAGTLEIEIGGVGLAGTDYDLLEVAGNATLAGQLDVVLLHGFQAALGDYFDVLTTTGTIDITGLDLVGHLPNSLFGWWEAAVRDGANGGAVLRLTAVPEPSGAVLVLSALVGLFAAMRRRR